MRGCILLLAILVISSSAVCQVLPSDSQTLRALLDEVRQLRQDLRTSTATTQRMQIALYRLQVQDAAVARVARLVSDAQSTLSDLAGQRERLNDEMQRTEEARDRTTNPAQRRDLEEYLPQLKLRMEDLGKEEKRWQARLLEAEGQLKAEQDKLDALQAVLDQLDRALDHR